MNAFCTARTDGRTNKVNELSDNIYISFFVNRLGGGGQGEEGERFDRCFPSGSGTGIDD